MKNKNMLRRILCGMLCVPMLLPLLSCNTDTSFTPVPLSGTSTLLSAGFTRKAAKSTAKPSFYTGFSDMAFTTFREVAKQADAGENMLYSPLSAAVCLAMIENGAGGNTKAQLETLFGMDRDTMNKGMQAYIDALPSSERAKLGLADSLWIRDSFIGAVKSGFLQANADYYGADVFATPFDKEAVRDLNQWVKNNTDGMIDGILPEDEPVAADTVMYLINALVFDAKWQTEYEASQIGKYPFYAYDKSEKSVDMMTSAENLYLQTENATGFMKYYDGGAYAFTALLPDEGVDVYDLVAGLDGSVWRDMLDHKIFADVTARIPEFTYDTDIALTEVLEALGVTDMFGAGADFSAIADAPLSVTDVKQKTHIEVSRHGTKAAAVTWGEMKCTSAGPRDHYTVILDRPFVYAITDTATGLPVFLGIVTNVG